MLAFLDGKVSERKLRLFACACCRRIWHLLTHEPSRQAVEVAERYADGAAGEEELSKASFGAQTVASDSPEGAAVEAASASVWLNTFSASHYAAFAAASRDFRVRIAAHAVRDHFPLLLGARDAERLAHCGVLRDLLGPLPFRPITNDASWLTWHSGLLVSMAQRMYDSRDFSDMPVLADALEESGCQNQDILGHCRSGGEHVRGCWVVDLLLGKE
jgi:hypothetical protein